jgi:hypothetical protein
MKGEKIMATKTTNATKKEFNLERACTLWIYKSKKGNKYLSGKTADGETKLKGFFNSKKENPKEPDIRLYTVNEKGDLSKDEFASLWCNATEGGKKYTSGKIDGKRVVGFFNSKAEINGIIPYLNVYLSDDEQKPANTESKKTTKNAKAEKKEEPKFEEVETDNDLPF